MCVISTLVIVSQDAQVVDTLLEKEIELWKSQRIFRENSERMLKLWILDKSRQAKAELTRRYSRNTGILRNGIVKVMQESEMPVSR